MQGKSGLDQYRTYQATTVAPEDRVALLYDGTRRFVDQALRALEREDYEEVSRQVGKAQRILEELSAALNFDAGQLAENLFLLYDYWSWRLGQGLIHKDPAAFREVSAALDDMHGAWVEAAKAVRAQRGSASVG